MLSVSSSSSTPMLGWPLDEAMYSYSMNHGFYDHTKGLAATGIIDHPGNFAPSGEQTQGRNGDAKKVNHNASERHRRKKINELYSSLRSLLPASEQSRRMSIPTTVDRVLKYIPKLQEEVERMEKKKQAMSKKINQNQGSVSSLSSKIARPEHYRQEKVNEVAKGSLNEENCSISNVSISKVGDREVVIQISTLRISVPEILMSLEKDGFQLISASSSESSGGRVFLNLHLQKLFGIENMDCEALDEKLLSMMQKNS
ncbi:hypothetical protein QQ045_012974 [Rhodiola kirilowii]